MITLKFICVRSDYSLENLNVDEDVNRAWENIKENIKTSAKDSLGMHKLKQHKPWFKEER
jgi:hypothetical protein